MKEEMEKPKIKPFKYNKKMLNITPIIVIPKIHIIIEYDKLVKILFLNANMLSMEPLFTLDINNCIFSNTNFLSFKSIIFENIAPDITPRNRIVITKILVFLLGNIILLILLYLFFISSPS